MAQLTADEVLERILAGNIPASNGLLSLVNRDAGRLTVSERKYLDFKETIDPFRSQAIAELARDVLGFSNTEGGILLLGVANDGRIVGHRRIDPRVVRNNLGPYIGTRVNYEVDELSPVIGGQARIVPFLLVRRSVAGYPTLLRKDIEIRPGLARKLKYLAGSLFYRDGDQTLVEPVGADIESRAIALNFRGAAPRTRSSFLLLEDKPGLRLYSHINDRFFGRDAEVGDILSKFDDPRGKGVSLAGLGGVGKTELAIRVVQELHRRGKFRLIYSGSAKQSLLGPSGSQPADPAFWDLFTFLRDVMAWLGLDVAPDADSNELSTACVKELLSRQRVLLFVDNLETVHDRRLIDFLDNRLPTNCWVLTTGRVHKVRNFVYPKEVRELEARDAARLLRHELRRQGLPGLASTDIKGLEKSAELLYRHPLALRWFAWACGRKQSLWTKGPGHLPMKELESFCVGHTLANIPEEAQKILGAIVAVKDQAEATAACLSQVSEVREPVLDRSLYDLECAGLVSAIVDDERGLLIYLIAPLAEQPARDLARTRGWEARYVFNLKRLVAPPTLRVAEDPLIRDLVEFDPRTLRGMSVAEIAAFERRVDRALGRCPAHLRVLLSALKAECQRHSNNLISADQLYQECADEVIRLGTAGQNERHARILLEAATVAKSRSTSEPQVKRAIGYLEAIEKAHFALLRVLGMLAELHSMLGNELEYKKYRSRATNLRNTQPGRFSPSQLAALDDALERAKAQLGQKT